MANSCPIEETKEFIELSQEVGEAEAYKIYETEGKVPTGEVRQAHIKRINTQRQKEANLDQRSLYEDIINSIENNQVEKLPNQEGYIHKQTGKKYSKRVSMLVDEYYRSQNIHFGEGNILKAKKGTVIHEYMRYIMEANYNNESPAYEKIFNNVKQLNNLEEFTTEEDSFFKLEPNQFKILSEAGKNLYEEIQALQKSIDPKGQVKLFFEISVGDKYRNVAGTIDMLAVFSDGSASMYDWKTFSKKGKQSPGTVTTGAWDVQLSNYRHILKDNYGINKFRHIRAIPIATSYSEKDTATGKWIHNIKEGFRNLAVKTKENNLDYLKPIPFGEETGDKKFDELLKSLRDKIKDLDKKIAVERHKGKRFKMMRSRKRVLKALNDLELTQDVEELFNYLRNLARVTKQRLAKSHSEDGFIEHDELVDMYDELKIFSQINVNFNNLIENRFEGEEKKKLHNQVIEASDTIENLMENINDELLDRLPPDILKPGQMPGNTLSKYLYGVGNWDLPVMREFTKLWRNANAMVRRSTDRDIAVIQEVDKKFSEWAKKNGHGPQEKFELLYNEKKMLHRKHTDEFYKKFVEIRKKAKNGLTADEKQWLDDNYQFNEEQLDKDYQDMKKELSYQLETTSISQAEYERRIREYIQRTHTKEKPNNRFHSQNFKYWTPKENLTTDINPKWQFIQDNKPVKEYYDMYLQFNRRFQEQLGPGMINENFVANVEQSVVENLLEHGTKNSREAFMKAFEVRQDDVILGRTNSAGEAINSIPVLYLSPLRHKLSEKKKDIIKDEVARIHPRGSQEFKAEVEKRIQDREYEVGLDAKSTDLTKSLMLFSQSVHEFIQMSKIEPMVKALKHLIDTDQVKSNPISQKNRSIIDKFTGFLAEKSGVDPEIKDIFNSFVNRMIYKKKFDKELMDTEKYSSNKIIMALMNWLSIRALGWNVVIGAANYIQGKTSMHMMAREGKYFSTKNMRDAIKAFAKHEDQYADIAEYFMPASRDIIREKIELSGASTGTRRITQRSLFLMHIKGDDAIDHTLTAAMAKNYVVDDDYQIKNPKTQELINKDALSVYDSLTTDEDGQLTLPGVTLEESEKFRAKIQKQAYLIKGTMNEEQKGAYASSIIWTMFMQFRSWAAGLGEARFGQLKYDPTMEEFEVGRYNIGLGTLFAQGPLQGLKEATKLLTEAVSMGLYKQKNRNWRLAEIKYDRFLANNPQYKGVLTLEQFEDLYKSKINGLLSELRMYLGILMLVQLMRGLDWDDEDDANIFSFNAFQITQRAFLEVSFWLNPRSVDQIMNRPLPLMGLFNELTKIIDSSVREVTFIAEGERPERVTTSPGYYILKSTPVVNQALDFARFFHQYNAPDTMTDHIFDLAFGSDDDE